jgi:hypothetical protein
VPQRQVFVTGVETGWREGLESCNLSVASIAGGADAASTAGLETGAPLLLAKLTSPLAYGFGLDRLAGGIA